MVRRGRWGEVETRKREFNMGGGCGPHRLGFLRRQQAAISPIKSYSGTLAGSIMGAVGLLSATSCRREAARDEAESWPPGSANSMSS